MESEQAPVFINKSRVPETAWHSWAVASRTSVETRIKDGLVNYLQEHSFRWRERERERERERQRERERERACVRACVRVCVCVCVCQRGRALFNRPKPFFTKMTQRFHVSVRTRLSQQYIFTHCMLRKQLEIFYTERNGNSRITDAAGLPARNKWRQLQLMNQETADEDTNVKQPRPETTAHETVTGGHKRFWGLWLCVPMDGWL